MGSNPHRSGSPRLRVLNARVRKDGQCIPRPADVPCPGSETNDAESGEEAGTDASLSSESEFSEEEGRRTGMVVDVEGG